jgi:hypothetical protein
LLLAVAFSESIAPATEAALPAIRTAPILLLRADCLLVEPRGSRSLAGRQFEVGVGSPGSARIELDWPAETSRSTLDIEAALDGPAREWPARLSILLRLEVPNRPPSTLTREVELTEGGSSLVEVWAEEPERIVLVLSGEWGQKPAVRPSPASSKPVRLRLAIEAVRAERWIPLETNDLATFVGEPVTYSFRRGGSGEEAESVELTATPVRIEGDLVQMDIEIAGRLPAGPNSPLVLAERRRLVASRGAVSSVTVTAGDPPRGYRFLFTPEF